MSLPLITIDPSERQALIAAIQAQWALLSELDMDNLLQELSVIELRRIARGLAGLCMRYRTRMMLASLSGRRAHVSPLAHCAWPVAARAPSA